MESEAQTQENSTTPTLSLFTLPHHHQHQHSSTNFTSPLHTSASVPFSWEEIPGKPLPCLTLALPSTNNTTIKCLDLPPRLLYETKFTKTPSPTTVLEGPYNIGKSYSFRFLRKRQGSFDGSLSLGGTSGGSSPERGLLGAIILTRSNSSKSRRYSKSLFGSWRKSGLNIKSQNDVNEGNFVFPSFFSDDCTDNTTSSGGVCGGGGGGAPVKVQKANFLGFLPVKSHFWAAIYGAFKQVIPSPRKSTKWKKDAW